jgi:hypothetical protein
MSESDPWYKGAKIPTRSDDWEIDWIAHRSIASDETFECEITGRSIPASSPHLLVTIRRKGRLRIQTEEFVVQDEDTLRDWVQIQD